MNFKLVIFCFALIAASQASVVVNTYSDSSCNETTIVAKTYSSAPCPQKRSLMQLSECFNYNGVAYKYDFSLCESSDVTIPDGWQFIKYGSNSSCIYANVLAAPEPLDNAMVAFFSDNDIDTANVTLSCADSTGLLTSESCIQVAAGVYACTKFTLENNVCTPNNDNGTFAISTSCVASPIANPTAEPSSQPTAQPLAGPVATPVKVPLNTPTAKTSDAVALLVGSAAVISSIIALI